MSNATQVSAADIAELELFTTGLHVLVACIALYCYEWFITFDQEINNVWAKGWSLATWVFAANRYGTLLIMIIQILPTPNRTVRTYPYDNITMSLTIPEQSCVWEIYLGAVFEILQFIVVAVFTASRAYALCDRKLWVFLTVFGLCMAPFATNMVVRVMEKVVFLPTYPNTVCSVVSPLSAILELRLELSTRLTVIAADIIVLVVTWRKVPLDFRALWRRDLHSPLLDFLIRDGTFFFLALLGLNVYEILINNVPALVSLGVGSIFLTPLNSIIISRFLLNLRQAVRGSGVSSGTVHPSSFASVNYSSLIGNMGEGLRFGDEEYNDNYAEEANSVRVEEGGDTGTGDLRGRFESNDSANPAAVMEDDVENRTPLGMTSA